MRLIISLVTFIMLLSSCSQIQTPFQHNVFLNEPSADNVPYNTAAIELYEAVGYNDHENISLKILDADEERILYTLQSRYKDEKYTGEGILDQTQQIGIYSLTTGRAEYIAYPEDDKKPMYVFDAALQPNGFLYLAITLNGKNDQYTLVRNGVDGTEILHTNQCAYHFTFWPVLVKFNTNEVLLLEASAENQTGENTKMYLIGEAITEFVEFTFPHNYKLLNADMTSCNGTQMMTVWEGENSAHIIISNLYGILHDIVLPSEYKFLSYTLTTTGILLSLQEANESGSVSQEFLTFISLEDMNSISTPFVPIYRMKGGNSGHISMGITSKHQYIIWATTKEKQFVVTPVDLTPWSQSNRVGSIIITPFGENSFLLNLLMQKKVVMVSATLS